MVVDKTGGKSSKLLASTQLKSKGHGHCDNPPRKVPYYRLRPIHFDH
jgi:hypothetical protein